MVSLFEAESLVNSGRILINMIAAVLEIMNTYKKTFPKKQVH